MWMDEIQTWKRAVRCFQRRLSAYATEVLSRYPCLHINHYREQAIDITKDLSRAEFGSEGDGKRHGYLLPWILVAKPPGRWLQLRLDSYYAALLPRRGRIMRRTLSVRLSVCLSVCLTVRPVVVITERHVAPPSELQ